MHERRHWLTVSLPQRESFIEKTNPQFFATEILRYHSHAISKNFVDRFIKTVGAHVPQMPEEADQGN